MQKGTLIIQIIEAQLNRDTETFGKMDPYVILKLNDQQVQTTTKINAGKLPVWKEQFAFRCEMGEILYYQIWDEDDGTADDLIIEGSFEVRETGVDDLLQLSGVFNNQTYGHLTVKVKFIKDGQEQQFSEQEQLEKKRSESQQIQQEVKGHPKLQQLYDMLENRTVQLEALKSTQEQLQAQINNLLEQRERKEKEIVENEQKLQHICSIKDQVENKIEGMLMKGVKGKIEINDIELRMKDGGSMFDKLDPFLIFGINNDLQRLPTKENAGNHARWKETVTFKFDQSQLLHIFVMEENTMKNSFKGQAVISLFNLNNNQELNFKLPLYLKDKDVGEVTFNLKYIEQQ